MGLLDYLSDMFTPDPWDETQDYGPPTPVDYEPTYFTEKEKDQLRYGLREIGSDLSRLSHGMPIGEGGQMLRNEQFIERQDQRRKWQKYIDEEIAKRKKQSMSGSNEKIVEGAVNKAAYNAGAESYRALQAPPPMQTTDAGSVNISEPMASPPKVEMTPSQAGAMSHAALRGPMPTPNDPSIAGPARPNPQAMLQGPYGQSPGGLTAPGPGAPPPPMGGAGGGGGGGTSWGGPPAPTRAGSFPAAVGGGGGGGGSSWGGPPPESLGQRLSGGLKTGRSSDPNMYPDLPPGGGRFGASAPRQPQSFATPPRPAAMPRPLRAEKFMNTKNADADTKMAVMSAAKRHGVPPNILAALGFQESRFKRGQVGPERKIRGKMETAKGVFQIMPDAAAEMGLKPGEEFDVYKAADAAARYLRKQYDRFGNWSDALAAYNSGPRRHSQTLAGVKEMPEETQKYVPSVLSNADEQQIVGKSDIAREREQIEQITRAEKAYNNQNPVKATVPDDTVYPGGNEGGIIDGNSGRKIISDAEAEVEIGGLETIARNEVGNKPLPKLNKQETKFAAQPTSPYTIDQLRLAKAMGLEKGGAFLAEIGARKPESPWQLFNTGNGVVAVHKWNPLVSFPVAGGSAVSPFGKFAEDMNLDINNPEEREEAVRLWQQVEGKGMGDLKSVLEKGERIKTDKDGVPVRDENGDYVIETIKGSTLWHEQQEAERKRKKQEYQETQGNWRKYRAIRDAKSVIENYAKSNVALPITGLVGEWVGKVGGQQYNILQGALNTLRANIGFKRLQEMRDASPTGGALGPVSDFENRLLQAVELALEQSLDTDTLYRNLHRLERELNAQIFGHADGQAAATRMQAYQEEHFPNNPGPPIGTIDPNVGRFVGGYHPSDPRAWDPTPLELLQ